MIRDVPEQECYELLRTTTVGRVGFVTDGRVEIFPVNYNLSGQDVFVRTSSDGILRRLAEERPQVAFEIDYHDDLAGVGWSVLMHGELSLANVEDAQAVPTRSSPWAGSERIVPLQFRIESISGRRVRRDRR